MNAVGKWSNFPCVFILLSFQGLGVAAYSLQPNLEARFFCIVREP